MEVVDVVVLLKCFDTNLNRINQASQAFPALDGWLMIRQQLEEKTKSDRRYWAPIVRSFIPNKIVYFNARSIQVEKNPKKTQSHPSPIELWELVIVVEVVVQ